MNRWGSSHSSRSSQGLHSLSHKVGLGCLHILLVLALLGGWAGAVRAAPLAEFAGTGGESLGAIVGDNSRGDNLTVGQAFQLSTNASVREVQVRVRKSWGEDGNGVLRGYLWSDRDGSPKWALVKLGSKPLSELPGDWDWVSFSAPSATDLQGNTPYWVVLSVLGTGSAVWRGQRDNPYNGGGDTKDSQDGGTTWPLIQGVDLNFKLFADPVSADTTTAVAASPAAIAADGASTITVTVTDTGTGQPVGGTALGAVTVTAPDGSPTSKTLDLVNGTASLVWTPSAVGSKTIQATYAGHTFGGQQYNGSNGSTNVTVSLADRTTSTTLAIGNNTLDTRQTTTVTATVRDNQNNLVNGGTVSFAALLGGCAPASPNVVNGVASTTYTAPSTQTGQDTVTATFSGVTIGLTQYGGSSKSDSITVDYEDVATSTLVEVSPKRPYVGGRSFAVAKVTAGGLPAPGGSVQIVATNGSFPDSGSATVTKGLSSSGGRAWAKWTAPIGTGNVTFTATYQQHIEGGRRYNASSDTDSLTVVKDSDSDSALAIAADWCEDYSRNSCSNRVHGRYRVTGLVSGLESEGWGSRVKSDLDAHKKDFQRSEWYNSGRENDIIDKRDLAAFSGHGGGEEFYFSQDDGFLGLGTDWRLKYDEAYDCWGNKDCEWIALFCCQCLSQPSKWLSTFDGLHVLFGFRTDSYRSTIYTSGDGELWYDLMTQSGPLDTALNMRQAWFLMTDLAQPDDVAAGVLAEDGATEDDYVWGHGVVSADPSDDDTGYYWKHDADLPADPVARAGPDQEVFVDEWVTFDGSGSSPPRAGIPLSFYWDVKVGTNTDSFDTDGNGVDEADDDIDLEGVWPKYKWSSAGIYAVRLTVRAESETSRWTHQDELIDYTDQDTVVITVKAK